jgi:hypothetical protein
MPLASAVYVVTALAKLIGEYGVVKGLFLSIAASMVMVLPAGATIFGMSGGYTGSWPVTWNPRAWVRLPAIPKKASVF